MPPTAPVAALVPAAPVPPLIAAAVTEDGAAPAWAGEGLSAGLGNLPAVLAALEG